VFDIDAGNGGVTRIAVGLAIAAAHRVPNVGAGLWPRLTDTLAVAVSRFLGTVVSAWTFVVVATRIGQTRAAVFDIDAMRCSDAGVAISFAIAAAYRIVLQGADLRSRLADALAIAIALFLGTIFIRRTVGV